MTLRGLLLILLTCFSLFVQAATEIITLNYQTANDILPTAQSILGSEGRVSSYGNQLIVNAPPAKIDELRRVLAQLDRRPRRLLISVDTAQTGSQSERGYRVDGSASVGDVEITAGRGEINGKDQVRIINDRSTGQSAGFQQIQATEGYPALIQTGQSVPLTTVSRGPSGQVYRSTEYRDVTTGFYVTAILNGDRVNVTISSNNNSLDRSRPGTINVQSTNTRVNGQLGEWINIGGLSNQEQSTSGGFLQRGTSAGSKNMVMRLKVEALD